MSGKQLPKRKWTRSTCRLFFCVCVREFAAQLLCTQKTAARNVYLLVYFLCLSQNEWKQTVFVQNTTIGKAFNVTVNVFLQLLCVDTCLMSVLYESPRAQSFDF